ncbi:MAG: glycosyltransferase group 2 family protein [Spirochaetes bacterium]|nr:MAG: glycosyltransferase group 2 family protein [Spirochaetota bacterium]
MASKQKKPLVSILTATYDRAQLLGELKASLDAQDFRDFQWVVVDDGSSDHTEELLESWRESVPYGFSPLRTENGGKHRALNRGMDLVEGEWTFIVDSDDILPPGALRILAGAIAETTGVQSCGGVVGLKGDGEGRPLGGRFPPAVAFSDSIALRYRYGLKADKAEVFKTSVLRAFPFPDFEGEKFINEGVVWNRIARAGWTLHLLDEVIYTARYLAQGLSARSLELRIANPKGTALFYKEKLALDLPFSALAREAVNAGRFAFHAGRVFPALAEVGGMRKALAIGLLPLAFAAYVRDAAILACRGGKG